MAMARAFLRSSLEAETDPRAALVRANESLERDIRKGMFVTVLMAVLDPRESKVLLFSAGSRMPAARCAAGDAQWIHGEGIALGLDKGAVFERTLKPVEIVLVPGTRIALVNEGAALARSPDGKAFGEEKLLALLKQHGPKNSAAFVNLAVGTLEKHVGSGGFNVDVALVTAKRTA
jgi:serine phosphatase RsbU (regulator of sigma subunit)